MREKFIQIRVSEEERNNIKENAKMFGLSTTGYFKYLNATMNLKKLERGVK